MSRMQDDGAGTLYVVGTPIGNLDDLGPRARALLERVDVIAAEDTRRTRGLLSSIGAKRRVIAYHEHNEATRAPELIARMQSGASVALVSDAGMPLISDPGLRLIRAARANDLPVACVPGPSAVTAALSVCGLPTDRFVFEGFLPRRKGALEERLAALRSEPRTLVLFESVHRLPATLDALIEHLGAARAAALARELTKLHEQTAVGTLADLRARLGTDIVLRGEFVIVVGGAAERAPAADREIRRVFELLDDEVGAKRAVALTAQITGASRNEVYRLTRR
jgi:16S rRNA (cytidine1402-2'-O)-methyltransferase